MGKIRFSNIVTFVISYMLGRLWATRRIEKKRQRQRRANRYR